VAEDCIFCKIAAGELPAHRIREDERTVAFMDIAPATRGHALVIPRAHARDLLDVPPEDLAAVAVAAQECLPFPHARRPALPGRSAARALGSGAG
jgi:diadenosine tetraphosphate (Ap4A) HIT family hydrolase